ncbi:Peptidyl-prolyl cis-trans isomerase PpiD [hydrothermal vent metagenome]|uniref:Periplasmic chaperone PpiD n=1 Tax=hydrothermal vent metagenome TaxID=652676 RepID=A0A3B1AXL0_9ZZZZ
MLQQIRDRAQGIVIWIIVGLIIVTFALFGLSSYLTDTTVVNVATVNGADVTPNDFQRAYQNYQQRLQQALGDKYRPELFQEEKVKIEVLNSLINQELLNQELDRSGYRAAPEQIVNRISRMEVFQEDGKFSAERYKQILNSQRINSLAFEQQIARDLAEQQLTSGMLLSGFITNDELDRFSRLQSQKRELEYILLPRSHYLDSIELTQDEVEAYYDKHKTRFTTPEKVSVEYIEINLDDMSREIEISDEVVAEYYEQQRDTFTRQPEQRKARHILINVENTEAEPAALAKLKTIQEKLAAGDDFSQLAKEYSDDIGSARQGGDLGFFGHDVMDKAFEEAAFKLKKGEVSEPVRSRFGYHLIKLDDIKEAQVAKLEELKDGIRHDLQIQQAEQAFYETVDKLNNLSYEMPDSLAPVAESLGLELKTSVMMTRDGGAGLFSSAKLVAVAFSEEVLAEGRNSQLIELSDTHVVVLRMAEHIPAKQQPLNDVVEQLKNQLRDEKVATKIMADSVATLEQLRAGGNAEKLAQRLNLEWKSVGSVARVAGEADTLNPQIRFELFRMPRVANGQKGYHNVLLANGDGVVLILSSVIDGNTFTKENKLNGQRQLISIYGKAVQSAWMVELREHADVTINKPAADE